MSLLTVVQGVCAVAGVNVPASVFSGLNSNRTMQEMLALANDMATRIAYDEREWSILKRLAVFTGGVGEAPPDFSPPDNQKVGSAFVLPADYKRMLLNSNVWRSTSTMLPMVFISNLDEWTRRRYSGIYDARGEWAIHAGVSPTIHIAPPLQAIFPDPANFPAWQNGYPYFVLGDYAKDTFDNTLWKVMVAHTSANSGNFATDRANHPTYWTSVPITPAQTVHFNYLNKNCIALASGGLSDAFLSDNDTFILPERLLRLGMIWQWKANKGTAYAEDMANYQNALSMEAGADKPAPILVGTMPVSAAARVAYPWPITVGGQTI